MSVGLSLWWATPASPEQHFSGDELLASERYHRPLRRAAAVTVALRLGLLLAAGWLLAGPLARFGSGSVGSIRSESWLTRAGLLEIMLSRSLVLGAAGVAVALRLPSILVDIWFEYRFRPSTGRSDGPLPPVPVRQFGFTVITLTTLVWLVVVVAAAVGYRLMAITGAWPWLLVGVALLCVVVAAVVEERFRRLTVGEDDLDGAGPRFDHLADRFGLAGLRFQVERSGRPGPPVELERPNASTVGVGSHRRIVVSRSLLSEPSSLQEFVVAHELSHVKRHHVVAQSVAAVVVAVLAIQVVGAVVEAELVRARFGTGLNDPLLLPVIGFGVVVFGGVAGPVLSWFARFHERVADADAIAAVGPLPAELDHRLHAGTAVDLDPPWWIRLFEQHPTPTERLEFSARHRRAI